jgi:hypothetical protein
MPIRIPPTRAGAAPILALIAAVVLCSCAADEGRITAFGRERLFTLGFGKTESDVDLFDRGTVPLKTRIAMRSGLFFVANGPGRKLMKFSSYGDLLSMVYDPESNPEPLTLKPYSGGEFSLKTAQQYPFLALGEIAVDSDQTIYVEDRFPPARRVVDQQTQSLLSYAVLRFDVNGTFKDYLGQEGVGGTPFPVILSVKVDVADECVVTSMSQEAWFVHRFDKSGLLIRAVTIPRRGLPDATGEGLIAELDKIVPDPDGRSLLLKIDYYRVDIDPQTRTQSGVSFVSSWVLRMDVERNEYVEKWELPAFVARGSDAGAKETRVWEMLGASRGGRIFLLVSDASGATFLGIYELGSRTLRRFSLELSPDELKYSAFHLSEEGILSALLATDMEVRVVWWRFDRMFPGIGE